MSRKFEARYPGRCPSCFEPIQVGDTIVMTDDGATCEDCSTRAGSASPRPREVCPRCFTEKASNGACACDPEDGAP